jgi:hypothetical protein
MPDFGSGRKAWSVSDRSGRRFPYREMIKEPGTNLWVHKSESDGIYNMVQHPQGQVKSPRADNQQLEIVRGFNGRPTMPTLLDQNGEVLTFNLMFGIEEDIGI